MAANTTNWIPCLADASDNANTLMKAFVANLAEGGNLEDAVDVADSYSSINDSLLLKNMLQNVIANEQESIEANDAKGKTIYSLLKIIFKFLTIILLILPARLVFPLFTPLIIRA